MTESERRTIRVSIGPGLTIRDIDSLLKQHFSDGYQAGRAEGYEEGHAHGVDRAASEVRREIAQRVQKIIGGSLIHVVSGLTEVANRRRKTTIADERDWMALKAAEVQRAIKALGDVHAL
jgi:flagellar biosynthesis/type III secretory pathway protein FliH